MQLLLGIVIGIVLTELVIFALKVCSYVAEHPKYRVVILDREETKQEITERLKRHYFARLNSPNN